MSDNRMADATIARDNAGELVMRKKVKIHDLLPHAHQCAQLLTADKPEFSYEELREEFRATELANRAQKRIVLVFNDKSTLEFFANSRQIVAHEAADFDRVMMADSRTWGHPNNDGVTKQ